MEKISSEKREMLICYAFVLIGACLLISLTFNNNVWLDEAFTASLVNTDMAGVLSRSMNDTLPPLYNILLKLSTDIFGYHVQVMKITSAVFMILTMLLGATTVRKRHGLRAAVLFIIAVTIMPNMMFFGVEIRMYSLGFFTATASGIYAYEVIMDSCKKNWIMFTLFSVLAGYSHHFAFVTVGFVYLFLLLYYFFADRANIKRWFICLAATIVLYFPCLVTTLKQLKSVSGYFSMPEVTLSVFIKYMRYPYTVGCTPFSVLLSVLLIAFVAYTVTRIIKYRELRDIYALTCFAIYYGVLLFGTAVSKVMTANIFVDRYLFFSQGLIWLFFAIENGVVFDGIDKISEKKLGRYLFFLALGAEICIGVVSYTQARNSEYAGDPDGLIAYLEANVKPGDILFTDEDAEGLSLSLPFYDGDLTDYESFKDALKAYDEKTLNGDKVVLWYALMDGYDSSIEGTSGIDLDKAGDFAFDRYTFKLYKVIR